MVINYSPKKINFILIDFKGGLLVNRLRDLPHVKKVITSLDEKIETEFEYLRDELIRREKILSEYGENNIIGFNKKYPGERIPSLMIIIDEFAEMKARFPEYMKDIMSIARIGRTLEVHLLLSTQKPLGVVDDQIYANSRYKFCLRVNDKFESQEILNIPDASKIQYPGRGFLKQLSYEDKFDRKYACWTYNYKGWRKYKRSNHRTARRKLKDSQYWI